MSTQIIEHLSGKIGVRFAGTPAEEQSAQYLLEQFQGLGLKTSLDRFQFLGWELHEQPTLFVTSPVEERIPCFAFIYSPSTPPDGLELPLCKIGKATVLRGIDCNKYAMLDPGTGKHLAHVITRLDGPGCSMPLLDPVLAVPTVMVGGDEAQALERLTDEHPDLTLRLSLMSTLKPDASSCNVVATLPGKDSEKSVIVMSHYDTEYNSPGAVDNASGTQGVFTLAKRLSQRPVAKTVQFVNFGAEEFMLLGAKHYAQMLEETGALENVEAVINLDMIACNAPTWINTTQDDKEFKVRVARVFERFGVFQRFGDIRWENPPWPTSDHAPFTEAGIPTLFVSYEGQKYPHLHLPSDTIDKVDRELLDLSINFVQAILEDLVQAQ
jgi:aminopeptidase YwaD